MLLNTGSSLRRMLALMLLSFVLTVLVLSHLTITVRSPQWPFYQMPWSISTRPTDLHLSGNRHQHSTGRCEIWPDPGNVAIAVKTGATEAVEKIPMLMETALGCATNVKIYSDLEETVAGHDLVNALAMISESVMDGNSDFDFYWRLQEAAQYGTVEQLRNVHDPRTPGDLAAWTLDKYKMLHILEHLYESFPDKSWYLIIDADTYVVWSNLLSWLDEIDPDPATTKLYIGSPATVGDRRFAHGGSGILLSQHALREMASYNRSTAASWDSKMHEECCGDLVVGDVFRELGVQLTSAWPTINGEKPATLPFGPTHWCQPVVTMHHVQPSEMNRLASFELSMNDTANAMTFADLFGGFVRGLLEDEMLDWNNHAEDSTVTVDSFEACRQACEDNSQCFQFNHRDEQCRLGYSIHLGEPDSAERDDSLRSGWLRDRISSWVDAQDACRPDYPLSA